MPEQDNSFGRGFCDAIFGRETTNGKPSLSSDQLVVTAATAVGSFFLGKNVIAKRIKNVRSAAGVAENVDEEAVNA